MIAIDLTKKQLSGDSRLRNVSEICADSHHAGRIAAEHLLDRGFATFGFCGYQGRIWSERRQEGFLERLHESRLPCEVYESPQYKRTLLWYREQPLVAAWLRSLPKPVGIMTCNDIRGHQVIEACLQAGLRVPDDVAVVGVDEDRLLCDLASPPLSSVVLNLERAGYQAAELLDGLMAGRVCKPQRILVEALWVISRRSTDVVAIEDRHVAAAARFIRDHFRQFITVGDVVAKSRVSRRSLEIRFQQTLKRSLRQQIQQARLAWSKKLLVETTLSAGKIAELSGFSSLSYMSSVFQRELGMTLTDFRRQTRNP
jgi:LacI family transcriptional regulator